MVYALRNNSTLADMVLNNLGDAGQIKRRTYQRRLPENPNRDYYYIIRETTPRESILVEYGFIDNKNDLNKLQNNIEEYAEAVVKAIADYTNTPYSKEETPTGSTSTYIVQRGDTLWAIAGKYGISVNELKRLNNLTSDTLSIGQQLIVPTDEDVYIVQKGDSLWAIARKYGINVNDLINYNNLNDLTIYVGQQIKIPPSKEVVYTVKRGDTLYSIARVNNVSVDDIINANRLTSLTLFPNQQLIIPKK